ncbi:MAG: class I SAM-dependent methyltransferase [Hyphomicrobiaceae bacterium]|nr:class I SAM-dependent methyltransferase [Hyphomicrobiaceae bacterium]
MPSRNEDIDTKTIADFGAQWTRFPENIGWLGSVQCLDDHFGPLMRAEEFSGKTVADIGSGSGRIVNMLLDAGAQRVVAIEPSDAFYVLERSVSERLGRVSLVHATGEAVGLQRNLDFVVSLGVLHHVVDPQPIVKAALAALKPGGRLVVWLYGHEGNEAYLRVFGPVRAVTKRMPDWALHGLSHLLNVALDIYIPLARFLPLPMRDYMRNHLAKVDRRMRRITIFDQLNPAYAKYYFQPEARALLEDAGFSNVRLYHRHGYSWTVIGDKPLEAQTGPA